MQANIALLSGLLVVGVARIAFADDVIVPRGTVVFGELEQRITSNEKKFRVGYPVDGHVWKDVVVGGHTVISAGAPLVLRISKLHDNSIGGRGGSLRVMAVSVKAVDGSVISLTGGYDQAGSDRYGVARALSMVLWPAGFLPGKKAVLEEGTVFDASIPADTTITLPDGDVPTLKLSDVEARDLTVEILYDEINQHKGTLPLAMTLCNHEFTRDAHITAVNDVEVRPILVAINVGRRGETCHEFKGRVNLESLKDHFKAGINRFSVTMGGVTESVVLNIEM